MKFKRSATQPAGMVAAVAAKAHWNSHFCHEAYPYVYLNSESANKLSPMKGLGFAPVP